MKKITALILAVPLLLAGCSSGETSNSTPEAETVTESATVTTTQLSDSERQEQLSDQIKSASPIHQVNDGNLVGHCVSAIGEELPGAGDFDFPEPVNMTPLCEDSMIYTSTGDFRYEDAQDVWQDGFYSCQVITKGNTITDSSATAF